jgi:signal transduction histidine kinase
MMQRLRPSALDDIGLTATLEGEVQAWRARQPGIDYSLHLAGELNNLADKVNITLFRIMQECLTNIAKHAAATEVVVDLERFDDPGGSLIALEVRDNGVGMQRQSIGTGFGLIGMRERAEALNGSLEFDSAPGAGTTVSVTLPLAAADLAAAS